jgi:hypothetical protein
MSVDKIKLQELGGGYLEKNSVALFKTTHVTGAKHEHDHSLYTATHRGLFRSCLVVSLLIVASLPVYSISLSRFQVCNTSARKSYLVA